MQEIPDAEEEAEEMHKTCPDCHEKLSEDDELLGRCSRCGAALTWMADATGVWGGG